AVASRAVHSFPTRRSSDLRSTGNNYSARGDELAARCMQARHPDLKREELLSVMKEILALARVPSSRLGAQARQFLEGVQFVAQRSEEHTSELQSRENLVCR